MHDKMYAYCIDRHGHVETKRETTCLYSYSRILQFRQDIQMFKEAHFGIKSKYELIEMFIYTVGVYYLTLKSRDYYIIKELQCLYHSPNTVIFVNTFMHKSVILCMFCNTQHLVSTLTTSSYLFFFFFFSV